MKEIRKISWKRIKKACIEKDWYTCGDSEEYANLIYYTNKLENVTTDELEIIATDIKYHSDTNETIRSIMFYIANICCTTFIIND